MSENRRDAERTMAADGSQLWSHDHKTAWETGVVGSGGSVARRGVHVMRVLAVSETSKTAFKCGRFWGLANRLNV